MAISVARMMEATAMHDTVLTTALAGCCLGLRLDHREEIRLEASADFRFPPGFPGFQGHFPGNPILPAIIQLAAVRFVAERAMGHALQPVMHQKIKFKGIIRPDDPVTLTLTLKKDSGKWRTTFSLHRPTGEAVASGLAEFS